MKKPLQLLLLFILTILSCSHTYAVCKADFIIHRTSSNSFYLTDSSVCNKTQTNFTIIISDGHSSFSSYYNSNITIANNGTTRVWLMIHDSLAGCTDSISKTIAISGNKNCKADFYVSSIIGLQVSFKNLYLNSSTATFVMDFGDGSTSTTKNPTHTYATCGTFTAKLSVSDAANSCSDTFSITFKIGIKAEFTINQYSSNNYLFYNRSIFNELTQLFPDSNFTALHWDFGDGDTSNQGYVYHTYAHPGNYNVKLIARYTDPNNYCGKSDSIVKSVSVGCAIKPNFSYSVSGKTYTYTNLTLGGSLSYLWRFGDTTTSKVKHPIHTYKTRNNYLTELVAIDTVYGCRDSITLITKFCNIYADLQLVYDSAHPYQATLYNYSTGTINKHYWDFGDGSNSTSSAPTHNYSKTGAIDLKYLALDSITGCSDTFYLHFNIDGSGNIKRKSFVFTIIDKTNTSSIASINNLNGFKIYPNPFNKEFVIENLNGENIAEISLINALGQQISIQVLMENERCIINSNIDLENGVYIVRIKTDKNICYQKIIKE